MEQMGLKSLHENRRLMLDLCKEPRLPRLEEPTFLHEPWNYLEQEDKLSDEDPEEYQY